MKTSDATQITMFDYEQLRLHNNKYVRRIEYGETKPFLLGIHYARRMPCITDAFGLFIDEKMVGVVTYGVPASPNLCVGLAGYENRKRVLELNRLVLLPGEQQQNNASYLVAHSLKILQSIYEYVFVVSYADWGGWGHVGYVYQATNFLYTGLTKARTDIKPINGGHSRHYEKGEKQRVQRSAKHRYVYLVGDKRHKKQMLKELQYPVIKDYPKGDTRHYDTDNPVSLLIDGKETQ